MKTLTSVVKELGEQSEESVTETRREDSQEEEEKQCWVLLFPQTPIPIHLLGGDLSACSDSAVPFWTLVQFSQWGAWTGSGRVSRCVFPRAHPPPQASSSHNSLWF